MTEFSYAVLYSIIFLFLMASHLNHSKIQKVTRTNVDVTENRNNGLSHPGGTDGRSGRRFRCGRVRPMIYVKVEMYRMPAAGAASRRQSMIYVLFALCAAAVT